MVPFYQFYDAEHHGKDSNGAPNYAWIVEKGPWTATYTRAGKLEIVEKDEENTDYFKTGLAGNKGDCDLAQSSARPTAAPSGTSRL